MAVLGTIMLRTRALLTVTTMIPIIATTISGSASVGVFRPSTSNGRKEFFKPEF